MRKTLIACALLFAIVLSFSASASYLVIVDPVKKVAISGEVVDLGIIGPGQKIELVVDRASGENAKGISYEKEAKWDKVLIAAEMLPARWTHEDSKFYEQPLRAFVTAAKDAEDGIYYFTVRAFDEYEGIDAINVKFKVRISRDMLDATLLKKHVEVGVGQPALYFLRLKNKSSANDVFEITISGLPLSASYGAKQIFVKHGFMQDVPIELSGSEQGEYEVVFKAKSLSSDAIAASDSGFLVIFSSLLNDMRAVADGILLFPSVEQSIHSMLGIIAQWIS